MNALEIKKKIRVFNKTHEKSIYTQLMDIQYPSRCKCKECGDDIIFPQTKIHYSNDGVIYPTDGCFKTIKKVNNTEYSLKVCYDCLSQKYEIKNPSRCFNVMSKITAYAFDIPENDFIESRKEYAMTLEHMIEKYGEEEGRKKWDSYCKRQSETNTFEYKQKQYGWSIDDFNEFNQSRAVTLKNMVKRYGEEEGRKKWDGYCKRQSETKSWDYMVEKFGEQKARDIIRQRLTGINDSGFSKVSQELFESLDKYLSPKYTTHFATKDYEVEKSYKNLTYRLDYFIEELNLCIEFNGSVFHADPRLFKEKDHPNPFNRNLTAKQIWEHDSYRYKILKDVFGINTMVIWEIDYRQINIEELVQKIINF